MQRVWPAHRLECSSCEKDMDGYPLFADALTMLELPFRCAVRQRVGADLHYEMARDRVGVTMAGGGPALAIIAPTVAERAHHATLAAALPQRVPAIYRSGPVALVTGWLSCCLHDNLNRVRTAAELAYILNETVAFIRELAALGIRHGQLDAQSIFIEEDRVLFANFAHVGLLTPPALTAAKPPRLRTANDEIIAFFTHMATALSVWSRAGLPLQVQLPGQDEARIRSYLCALVELDGEVVEVLCPESYTAKRERPREEEERRKRQRLQRPTLAAAASPPTIKS